MQIEVLSLEEVLKTGNAQHHLDVLKKVFRGEFREFLDWERGLKLSAHGYNLQCLVETLRFQNTELLLRFLHAPLNVQAAFFRSVYGAFHPERGPLLENAAHSIIEIEVPWTPQKIKRVRVTHILMGYEFDLV